MEIYWRVSRIYSPKSRETQYAIDATSLAISFVLIDPSRAQRTSVKYHPGSLGSQKRSRTAQVTCLVSIKFSVAGSISYFAVPHNAGCWWFLFTFAEEQAGHWPCGFFIIARGEVENIPSVSFRPVCCFLRMFHGVRSGSNRKCWAAGIFSTSVLPVLDLAPHPPMIAPWRHGRTGEFPSFPFVSLKTHEHYYVRWANQTARLEREVPIAPWRN